MEDKKQKGMGFHNWGQRWLLACHTGILILQLSWAGWLGQRLYPWVAKIEQKGKMCGRFIWSFCRQWNHFEDLNPLSIQKENISVLETVLLQRKSSGLGDGSSSVGASSFWFNDLGQIISLSHLPIYKVRSSPCLNYLTGLLVTK